VQQALAAGFQVQALVRTPGRIGLASVTEVMGDVLDRASVRQTIESADAVLSCLGSKPAATYMRRGRIAAPGIMHVVSAMQALHLKRLIALSTYGAGDSWRLLRPSAQFVMGAMLWGELADKNGMEAAIRGSNLAWTILRPVNLKDGPATGQWRSDAPSRPLGFKDWIARGDVAHCMLAMLGDPRAEGSTLIVR
jgi:uncharacterized protein YbjT (DUF2867 family)